MKQIRCFIASAFGYEDIDKIYDEAIIPVLKELKVKPDRVDRVNHNDKIDSKIISLINECDFGIVDLTYARPSVYYEAGLLEGLNHNVIYIARKDHFEKTKKDKLGNKKIHFDLITKNIIDWTTPDKAFLNKLRSRVQLIIRPLNQKLNTSQQEVDSRKIFSALTQKERVNLIQVGTEKFFIDKGFRDIDEKYFEKDGVRVRIFSGDTFTQRDIKMYNSYYIFIDSGFSGISILMFCSVKAIPRTRIETILNNHKQLSGNIYGKNKERKIFLDSIDSELKLEKTLNEFNQTYLISILKLKTDITNN